MRRQIVSTTQKENHVRKESPRRHSRRLPGNCCLKSSDHLSHAGDIKVFRDRLSSGITDEKGTLIERLQTFTIISTMRERTPFPASFIDSLPNLKVLLTTGPGHASIDTAACAHPARRHPARRDPGARLGADPGHYPQHRARRCCSQGRRAGTSLTAALKGKTLEILRLGRLGADTARVGARGFNMKRLLHRFSQLRVRPL
ncbi:hypothetical protein B0J12DRAFT_288967 [Macrophomina phaseolina]|uniref:Uncharacterized protein n=1 Tax=Macrophomina phaseolina TaxID=35725 RepID=A0ABQ8GR32_9PEZI|nr:hypothetical protein B0J12DRAFT_288967 [Macrophomina phaseolina]